MFKSKFYLAFLIQKIEDEDGPSANHKQKENTRVLRSAKRERKSTKDIPADKITTFLASMSKPIEDSLSFPEYLN